jgi:predicted dehydrogenase
MDRVQISLSTLKEQKEIAQKIDVPPERCFAGFDAYKSVINSGVDVVLLATPPHFRPLYLKAAVDAGKHVFAEKPVAVDSPGVRSVLATCEEAKKRNLSIVSGLCLRYSYGFRDNQANHDGALANSARCRRTTIAARSGSSHGSRNGQIWSGRCGTGITSPGFVAISTSSSMCIIWTYAPGS